MAGEPSLFLVYRIFTSAERESDSWYGDPGRGRRCGDRRRR